MSRLGGNGQHRQVAIRFDFLQAFHHLEAIHAGHPQIEQDQVVVVGAMQGADGTRIHRRRNAHIAGIPQHLLEQPHIGFLIVDDQNAGIKNIGSTHRHGDSSLFSGAFSATSSAMSSASMNSLTLIGLVR